MPCALRAAPIQSAYPSLPRPRAGKRRWTAGSRCEAAHAGQSGAMPARAPARAPGRAPARATARRTLAPLSHRHRSGAPLRAPASPRPAAVGAARVRRSPRGSRAEQPRCGPPRGGPHRQGGHLAGQHRRAVDADRRGRRGAGHPAPVASGHLPARHRRRGADARPGPQGAGRQAAPGGRPSGRLRYRRQFSQRACPGLDRLLRRFVPGLPARRPRPVAPRVHRRDRRAHRRHRHQPAPARRALHLRRAGRLGARHHLAGHHRLRLRALPAGGRGTGDRSGDRWARARGRHRPAAGRTGDDRAS